MKETISLKKEIGNEQQVKTRESNNWILALNPQNLASFSLPLMMKRLTAVSLLLTELHTLEGFRSPRQHVRSQ
jgi:hypothetical protein